MTRRQGIAVECVMLGSSALMFVAAWFWESYGGEPRYILFLFAAFFCLALSVLHSTTAGLERRFDRLEETIRECMEARRCSEQDRPDADAMQADTSAPAESSREDG